MVDSKTFYDQIAAEYPRIAATQQPYLQGVEREIRQRVSALRNTRLLDVGCGTGERTERIASIVKASHAVGIDESDSMLKQGKATNVKKQKQSILEYRTDQKYDLILCLWNVLGHINRGDQAKALRKTESLLSKRGRVFLDVNNRYNIVQYGWTEVFLNVVRDCVRRPTVFTVTKGDDNPATTEVHIFRPGEVDQLVRKETGLIVTKKWYLNYQTGSPTHLAGGQMLYELRRRM